MTMEEKVISVIARMFRRNAGELSGETLLREDLGAKSMNYLEINALLENEFKIDLPMDRIMKVKRISDIFELINEKLK